MSALAPGSERLEAARLYRSLGWWPLPIAHRQKRPSLPGWPSLRLEGPELAAHLAGPGNLGIILGAVSGGLTDIDLDCAEAVELAPLFLRPTWTYGRASKPRSHWLYTVPGGCAPRAGPKAYAGPDGLGLLELRSNRGDASGLQSVVPSGVHESGELIAWTPEDCDGTEGPLVTTEADLVERLQRLYAGTLLRRHAPAALPVWLATRVWPSVSPELTALAWGVEPAPAPPSRRATEARRTFDQAVEAYCRDNARPFPRSSRRCPMCGGSHGFGQLPGAPGRWACHSTSHTARHGGLPGKRGTCWHGDVLDLDAHAASLSRVELLLREGYLARGSR